MSEVQIDLIRLSLPLPGFLPDLEGQLKATLRLQDPCYQLLRWAIVRLDPIKGGVAAQIEAVVIRSTGSGTVTWHTP